MKRLLATKRSAIAASVMTNACMALAISIAGCDSYAEELNETDYSDLDAPFSSRTERVATNSTDGGADESVANQKYWGGRPVESGSTVMIGTDRGNCTAVAIHRNGGTVGFLTAAHCVTSKTDVKIRYWQAGRGGRKQFVGELPSIVRRHPSWDDNQQIAGNDIAIIITSESPFENLAMAFLWTGKITTNDNLYGYGFGANSNSGNGVGTLRTGIDDGLFKPDSVTEYEFADKGDDDARICGGDSGGPAFYNGNQLKPVAGLASRAVRDDGGACRGKNQWQRWNRIGPQLPWIEFVLPGNCKRSGSDIAYCF